MFRDCVQVVCLYMDDVGGLLWTGHADGKVSAFQLGPTPGCSIAGKRVHHWQARIGLFVLNSTISRKFKFVLISS